MPVTFLQNINGQNFEFLYHLNRCGKQLILLPQVMFCLRQFSEIIEELCQKRWIDYIRKNSSNAAILNQLPNLEQFMFEPSRNQLNAVANVLVELQDCCQRHSKIDPFYLTNGKVKLTPLISY